MNKYSRLSVRLSDRPLAKEVASEMDIEIEFKNPSRGGGARTESGDESIGVFCETVKEAEQFSLAFGVRRWEDSKTPQSE